MKIENYGYHFSYNDARYILFQAEKQFIMQYPVKNTYYTESTDGSFIQSQIVPKNTVYPKPENLKHNCVIGIKCLKDNIEGGFVRDIDLVFCVKHIIHESRHLYHQHILYQNVLSKYETDMACMDALSGYFLGYKMNTYRYLPSEIDAEICGLLGTVTFFNENIVHEDETPILDIKSCIFQKYKELPLNRVWQGVRDVKNFNDLIHSLEDQKYLYRYIDRGFPFSDMNKRDMQNLKRIEKYSAWEDLISCEKPERCNVEYDRKLFAMMMDLTPLWVQTHKGIVEEAKRISEDYPKQLPQPKDYKFVDALKQLGNFLHRDGPESL